MTALVAAAVDLCQLGFAPPGQRTQLGHPGETPPMPQRCFQPQRNNHLTDERAEEPVVDRRIGTRRKFALVEAVVDACAPRVEQRKAGHLRKLKYRRAGPQAKEETVPAASPETAYSPWVATSNLFEENEITWLEDPGAFVNEEANRVEEAHPSWTPMSWILQA